MVDKNGLVMQKMFLYLISAVVFYVIYQQDYSFANVTNQLHYNCAKYHKSVDNRPNFSNPISQSIAGYSKVIPKRVNICKLKKDLTQKRQSSLSVFFKSRCAF